jgi:hypothetical protein
MRLLGASEVGGELELDAVAELVDLWRPMSARTEPVLALTSAADAGLAEHTLSLARAAAPGATGVVHGSDLPPLARERVVDLLAALAASHDLGAGQLLVVCEAIERTVVAGAVVRSVTRLASPGPSMGQHLRSWWPPSRFVVTTHPHETITSVGRETGDLPLTAAPTAMHGWVTTGDPAAGEIARAALALVTGRAPDRTDDGVEDDVLAVVEVDVPAQSRRRWATSRFVEFCALPVDVDVVVRTALASAQECRSCGAPVAWAACRICHARRPVADAVDLTETESAAGASAVPITRTQRRLADRGAR